MEAAATMMVVIEVEAADVSDQVDGYIMMAVTGAMVMGVDVYFQIYLPGPSNISTNLVPKMKKSLREC